MQPPPPFLPFLFLLLASSLPLCLSASPLPNVLIIVSDDQGFADTSWTGGVFPTTNLETLRNESTALNEFYVHPVCTPSRAALYTGKYAAHSGMTGPLLLATPCHLKDDQPTFAREMKNRGYYTAQSGKWHLGHHSWKHTPVGHGFDEFHGVLNCCCAYYSKSYFHPLYGHKIDWRNNTEAVAPAPSKHSSEEFADRLIEIIETHHVSRPEQPLFMMLTLTAPHSPLQSEERHTAMCAHVHTDRRRTFCGLMMSVDEAVARVRAAMEKHDMWDNSIVTFMNDNGGNVWEGGRNYPYRGGKMSSFEGGSRATAFMKFPSSETNAPSQYNGLAHIADVMPTILGYIDRLQSPPKGLWQPPPGDAAAGTGYDFSLPLLGAEEGSVRTDVLMSYEPATNKLGYRYDEGGEGGRKWKLVAGEIGDPRRFGEPQSDMEWIGSGFHDMVCESIMWLQHGIDEDASGTLDETVREVTVLVSEWWGNVFEFLRGLVGLGGEGGGKTLLFDLSVDPYEDHDVSAQHPEVVSMMRARVARLESGFGANCDWFVMDTKVEFEEVSYPDPETGETVVKQYHSPWVPDDEYEDYEPTLVNIGPARKYGAAGIMLAEVLVVLWVAKRAGRVLGLGGGGKRKQD
ncbi:hypothetical protein TeGR_g8169 [Tetraparma gracilis]|uniref:Sulfatase N-terminal domain-containing protein n=1 Tax=Tetraparma gracilis TaxID=2962635 RepID=A0ABQ6N367_9STRA|nr:hypothetical protein TeGR_g8169 [Tetraparma gracilis]